MQASLISKPQSRSVHRITNLKSVLMAKVAQRGEKAKGESVRLRSEKRSERRENCQDHPEMKELVNF